MSEKYPKLLKAIVGGLILFSSVGVYASIKKAAEGMRIGAWDMMYIESISGNTIDEAFYQKMGAVYRSLADVIFGSAAIVLIAGIAISVMLIYPIIADLIQKRKTKIIAENNQNTINCPYCGAKANETDVFCASCGKEIQQIKNSE